MHRSLIHVSYRSGSKPQGMRVSLSFHGLLGGVTKDFRTDKDGTAIVEHSSTGTADVIVDGTRYGSLKVPGETVVFLK